MSDPRLVAAMAEMNVIMRKYDIGGHITLVSQTHSQYSYRLDPSWSCASVEVLPGGDANIHVKALRKDFPDRESQIKRIAQTEHLFSAINHVAGKTFMEMDHILKLLKKTVDFDMRPIVEPKTHWDC